MAEQITIFDSPKTQEIAPGVSLEAMQPGGRFGPDDIVVKNLVPGGAGWTQSFRLGDAKDDFVLSIPDIRMPPNQIWPLHWHDCWIAVIIMDGSCIIGDWWMQKGDILISAAELEYGPVVNGPEGCQLFEIFAKEHLAPGGYAPEYKDHPTLVYSSRSVPFVFKERSALNQRNNGKQVLPVDGVEGLIKGHLDAGQQWDLGEANDPERGILSCVGFGEGDRRAAAAYGDWHALVVLEGAIRADGRKLGAGEILIARPNNEIPALEGVSGGAKLLEVSRTARGSEPMAR